MTTTRNYSPQPGDDLKFRITTHREDFQLSDDPWRIVIRDQWGRVKRTVTPESCFYDTEGRFYFTLESVRQGIYYAYFTGSIEDEDYDKQRRVWNDRQVLVEVGLDFGCSKKEPCCRADVTYEQVWSVSIDGSDYLADCDGKYVLTGDGKRIQFTNNTSEYIEDMAKVKMKMTGDEFLKLIEGRDPNSEIDTIPELMDAMHGISDDTTVIDEIDEQVDEDTPGRVTPEDLENFQI